jgi:hypothetical protein
VETNGIKGRFKFPCHKETIKHDGSQDSLYCICCGENHDLVAKSNPQKTGKSNPKKNKKSRKP